MGNDVHQAERVVIVIGGIPLGFLPLIDITQQRDNIQSNLPRYEEASEMIERERREEKCRDRKIDYLCCLCGRDKIQHITESI